MKKLLLTGTLALLVIFQFCSTAKKAQSAPAITYTANVHPIITGSCAPCHISGGKQKTLNNYLTAKEAIEDILTRIQKNPDEKGFMPMKHPKLPDSTIQVLIQWKNAGMPE